MKRLKSVIDLDTQRVLLCDPECPGPLGFVNSKLCGWDSDIITCIFFSPVNSNLFVSASGFGPVKLWKADTLEEVWAMREHTHSVKCVCFSPDGNKVASGSLDHSVIISDAHTGKVLDKFDCKSPVYCLDFHSDGNHLVCGLDGNHLVCGLDGNHLVCGLDDCILQLWSIKTKKCVKVFKGHEIEAHSCAVSPDGSTIVSGDYDGVIKVWDRVTGECKQTWKKHKRAVFFLFYSKTGKRILSCSDDKTVILWNVKDGKVVQTFKGHADSVRSCALSIGEAFAFTASEDNTVKIWDTQTGACLQTISFYRDAYSLSLSPDQFKIIVGFDDGSLSLLRRLPGSVTQSVSIPVVPVSSVLSIDQSTVVVTTEKEETLIIDTITGNILDQTATNGADICLDVNGQTLVSKRVALHQYEQRCIMAGFLLLYGAGSKFSDRFKLSIWDVEEVFCDGIVYPDLGMDTDEIYRKIIFMLENN